MKALVGGDSARIAKWFTVGMFASAFGCSVYDEGLLPGRNTGAGGSQAGAGGSQAGAGGALVDASSERGASGGASGGNGGASGAAGAGAAGSGGSGKGGAAGSEAGGGGGASADPSDAPFDQGHDRTVDVTVDASERDGANVDARDAAPEAGGPGADAPSVDANLGDANAGETGIVDATNDGGPVVGLAYNIIAKHSGKCMTVLANLPLDGTEIIQVACSNADSQRFRLQAAGIGAFTIVNDGWNKCIAVDISDSATVDHVQLVTCDGSAAQTYTVTPVGTAGGYTVKSGARCMEVDGASSADLTNIIASTCDGGANQEWQFVPAPRD